MPDSTTVGTVSVAASQSQSLKLSASRLPLIHPMDPAMPTATHERRTPSIRDASSVDPIANGI